MAISIGKFLGGAIPQDTTALAQLSDNLWRTGSLQDIEQLAAPELFDLFVVINTIGIWQGDGWSGIVGDNPALLPHIPRALETLGMQPLAQALREVLELFPPFTVFADSALYCDIVNYLTNTRFRVGDERLLRDSPDKRARLCARFRERMNALEELTDPLWGYNAPFPNGWDTVLDYIRRHCGS